MRLLVTGGAGFIGSNFIHYILQKYPAYKIVNLDKLTYAGNLENLKNIENNPNYKFIKGDICDINRLELDNYKFDWIVNFAAESHVDRSINDSHPFLRTNILGTHALLEFARENSIPFCQISTDEVYGEIFKGSNNENSSLKPSSPYAASKAGTDLLVLAYHRTHGLPFIITRSTNNYGPYQYPEKLIPYFTTQLLRGKKVGLYGDGKQIRDWLWVGDHVRAIELLFQRGNLNEIYNISSGNELSNLEVTKMILKTLKLDDSWIEFIEDRKGHDRRYSLNCKKMREFGWRPSMDFEEGLSRTIIWYREHQDYWRKKCTESF